MGRRQKFPHLVGGSGCVSPSQSDDAVDQPFAHHRDAALALLNTCPNLSRDEAGFLGNALIDDPLSRRQHNWLVKLLKRHGLPKLCEDGTS